MSVFNHRKLYQVLGKANADALLTIESRLESLEALNGVKPSSGFVSPAPVEEPSADEPEVDTESDGDAVE